MRAETETQMKSLGWIELPSLSEVTGDNLFQIFFESGESDSSQG